MRAPSIFLRPTSPAGAPARSAGPAPARNRPLPPPAFPLNFPRRWSPQGARGNAVPNSAAAPATVSGEPDPHATGAEAPGRRVEGPDPRARRPAVGAAKPQALGRRAKGTRDMTTTTLATSALLGRPAARHRRPPRPLHHRLRRLLPARRGPQRRPRLPAFDGLPLPLRKARDMSSSATSSSLPSPPASSPASR